MRRLRVLLLPLWFWVIVMCLAAVPAFEIVPLETVSETSSNASIGDLNGDGHPDIVLVKGRHWQLTTKVFLGDGKGHFAPGPPLPGAATKSYSGSLADMTKSGHLDIVLSNDAPDPKLVLVNDGTGRFTVGGTYAVTRNGQPGMRRSAISTAMAIRTSRLRTAARPPTFATTIECCISNATRCEIHPAPRVF